MRERAVEEALIERIEALGGLAIKFVSPGRRGVPDRLVILPGGRVEFVELKAPGKKPEPHQAREHARYRRLGATVHVIDTKECVDQTYPLQ